MKTYLLIFLSVLLSFSIYAQSTVTLNAEKDNTLYEDPAGLISNGAGEFLLAKVVIFQCRLTEKRRKAPGFIHGDISRPRM